MACEEADMFYRWQLLQQIAKGKMPDGVSEDDLRAMDLPLPHEVELIEEPDGTMVLRKREPAELSMEPAAAPAAGSVRSARNPAPASAFVCDSPDE
ncbi:MAG TPA: hypothetical protein VNQ99_14650 [Xanthobacteraceae bacterium]|nr:hypothetical protein [Xanthobacteraceae bacterium]